MESGPARRIKLFRGEDGQGKLRVDYLTNPEKKKIKKILKGDARIFSGKRGIFVKAINARTIESIALDLGEELKIPLEVPNGISLAHCFATRYWPSVPFLP